MKTYTATCGAMALRRDPATPMTMDRVGAPSGRSQLSGSWMVGVMTLFRADPYCPFVRPLTLGAPRVVHQELRIRPVHVAPDAESAAVEVSETNTSLLAPPIPFLLRWASTVPVDSAARTKNIPADTPGASAGLSGASAGSGGYRDHR